MLIQKGTMFVQLDGASRLSASLDAYGEWLEYFFRPSTPTVSCGVELLQHILELRREQFPELSHHATELAVLHMRLVSALYMRDVPGAADVQPRETREAVQGIVKKQIATVQALRRPCRGEQLGK